MSAFFKGWLGHQPEAMLFDLDGTLVDSVPDIAVAIDAMLLNLGYATVSVQQVSQWVGNGARKLVERALRHAQDSDAATLDDDQFQAAYEYFLLAYGENNGTASRLFPGVYEALRHWQDQGMSMAIVTNKPIQFVPQLLQRLDIADCFEVMLGGECVAAKKPEPLMLLDACERLQSAPDRCVMVGDSRNDVEAAARAGMPMVAVTYGYNHGANIKYDNPDRAVDDLREMIG